MMRCVANTDKNSIFGFAVKWEIGSSGDGTRQPEGMLNDPFSSFRPNFLDDLSLVDTDFVLCFCE